MRKVADRITDQRLLDAILLFAAKQTDPDLQRFHGCLVNWGQDWREVAPFHHPASDLLTQMKSLSNKDTDQLVTLFTRERHSRRWEQAYTRADRVVDEGMLANYGYVEIVGKHGPFVSDRIRAGYAVYGPGLVYPPHRHAAEEIYVVLSGQAMFQRGGEGAAVRVPGDVIHHPSQMFHSLRTGEHPVMILYLWQNGDLREKPSFD